MPEIAGVSAGGMPDRVKCLHALVGHALAAGPGVNPLGDEALDADRGVLGSTLPGGHAMTDSTESSRTVAAIDCGTNSIRLLIADPADGGGLIERDRRTEIVRLGQGVDATGEFHPDALARTFAAVEAYAAVITAAGVPTERIQFVATSASRDARNRDAFFDGVRERLGVLPDVISGDREAQLSFTGALSRVRPEAGPGAGDGHRRRLDRAHRGHGDRGDDSAISLDIGSVRVTERFLKTSPPTADELAGRGVHRRLLDRSDLTSPDRHLDRRRRDGDHPGRGLSPLGPVRPRTGARLEHPPRRARRLLDRLSG